MDEGDRGVSRQFLHQLRNVLGPVEIDAELAGSLLRSGKVREAEETLAKLLRAVRRARDLLHGVEAGNRQARARVLVVDDDEENLTSMAKLLELEGFEVVSARSVATALEQARSQPIAVVLCDLSLAGGTEGLEVARRLAARPSRPYLIACSGFDGEDMPRLCADAGFDRLFVKPAASEALLAAVRAGADRRPAGPASE